MRTLFGVMAFLFAASGIAAGTDGAPAARSTSVAEMLQIRQEHQMRERLVSEGRMDEVRRLDEEQLAREQARAAQTLAQLNDKLARDDGNATVNDDGVFLNCLPERKPKEFPAVK